MNAKLDGEFQEFMHARWPSMVRLAYGAVTLNQGATAEIAGGVAPASAARVVITQPDGTHTQVRLVTIGGEKLFAVVLRPGTKPPGCTAYDSSGRVIVSSH